ncbi:type II toxin-antitoxin system VapC family toxin [Luteolibacter pohnpeiensis]|uniref:Type II toxin-antitoxin system VapC family toxin n=1 Tax=Luteolibacter pohnpeiensis TaxID=454153 RepID=A0A934VV88_9BACT|nr:type II toxin-antitoxin system VapC family toxin [Luteolibacter pohnpeiensis]MBK1881930.1 type II toxin-antitoxin system VapC family toxin [Luteolibacter pohnpeiensis]
MAYLLDTNVICEATAKQPDLKVLAWLEMHSADSYLSALTLGEIWKGIRLMPAGKRKNAMAAWAEGIERDFTEVILNFDVGLMKTWAGFYAEHESKGRNLGLMDSLIASTALHHDLILVTRNVRDFPADIRVINPWD